MNWKVIVYQTEALRYHSYIYYAVEDFVGIPIFDYLNFLYSDLNLQFLFQ